jgi:ribonuclease D
MEEIKEKIAAKIAKASRLPPRKYPTPEEIAAERETIAKHVKEMQAKLNAINTRKRVWQVRFLNAVANKLHAWGDSVKTLANRIDMPTLPRTTKTELDKIVKVAGVPTDKTFVPQPYIQWTTNKEEKK